MNVSDVIKQCDVEVIKDEIDCDIRISTDTRTIKKGCLYLPLKGENFDGEKFIQEALDKGAIGYFTTSDTIYKNAKIIFKVKDTLTTYLQIASCYIDEIKPKVIAITGSSGKTTTKEILYSVLKNKFKTVKTYSNHNNEIGFCQTAMSVQKDTDILIVEMGMRGLGEIDLITKYAKPDYAIITNCGSAHLGRLGSLENIAKAKCEITNYLKEYGAFISADQEIIKNTVNFNGKKIYCSLKDVSVLKRDISYTKFLYKDKEYELQVAGDYNIANALLVIELANKLSLDYELIKQGLYEYKPIEKRWEEEIAGKFKIINDSYNANPESMKASVETFTQIYKNPVVVLGNMGELGSCEIALHKEVGKYFAKMKNVKFLTVGDLANEISKELTIAKIWTRNFANNKEVSRYILDNFDEGNTIFLKASRAMKFEEIIEHMKRGNL